MVTVLEECTTEEQNFFLGKRSRCIDIHKELFPVYSGESSSHKAVHNLVEKRGKSFADDV
jgi:hypothetical protein